MKCLDERVRQWRSKEFTDGTKPSDKLVSMLDRLATADEDVLKKFRAWVVDQPDTRDTQILKWCAIYRAYELKNGNDRT